MRRDAYHFWIQASLCWLMIAPAVTAAEWNTLGRVQELGSGITPGLCVDPGGAIHVVYMNGAKILYRRADPTLKFGAIEELPTPEGTGIYNSPHLVCDDSGALHLVFQRDFTKLGKKAWYTWRKNGVWQTPHLVIDHEGSPLRANYPRLAVSQNRIFVGAFSGGSTLVAMTRAENGPVIAATLEIPLWVGHPMLPPTGELLVVGRDGSRGHKLERYTLDLKRLGEPMLLSVGTPEKTGEGTAAILDERGVVHAAGTTGVPDDPGTGRLWYTTSERATAGKKALVGIPLGSPHGESTYPVLARDARQRTYLSYRHGGGSARLTVVDAKRETFAEPVVVAESTTQRLRWNPHLAVAREGGAYVAWDDQNRIYFRAVGEAAESTPTEAASTSPTREENAQGWKALFDGRTLEGWRGFKTTAPPASWTVVGGEIVCAPPRVDDLASEETFGDFELSLEWKLREAGNSGILYRVELGLPETYQSGPEYQLLDNLKAGGRNIPDRRAGALYGLVAPASDSSRPVEQWNQTRILVRGWRVEHWLNGVKCVDIDLATPAGQALIAASKFATMPRFAALERGRIVLQDYGTPVSFRKIEIRALAASPAKR